MVVRRSPSVATATKAAVSPWTPRGRGAANEGGPIAMQSPPVNRRIWPTGTEDLRHGALNPLSQLNLPCFQSRPPASSQVAHQRESCQRMAMAAGCDPEHEPNCPPKSTPTCSSSPTRRGSPPHEHGSWLRGWPPDPTRARACPEALHRGSWHGAVDPPAWCTTSRHHWAISTLQTYIGQPHLPWRTRASTDRAGGPGGNLRWWSQNPVSAHSRAEIAAATLPLQST